LPTQAQTGKYGVSGRLIDLQDHVAAQNSPGPLGTFVMLYNGKIISHHPISNTRFENIMNSLLNP
jgi:hypothetical protein